MAAPGGDGTAALAITLVLLWCISGAAHGSSATDAFRRIVPRTVAATCEQLLLLLRAVRGLFLLHLSFDQVVIKVEDLTLSIPLLLAFFRCLSNGLQAWNSREEQAVSSKKLEYLWAVAEEYFLKVPKITPLESLEKYSMDQGDPMVEVYS